MDDLASAAELADMLDVRTAAIYEWRQRHADFPEPLTVLGDKMLIWSMSKVREWAINTGRMTADGVPIRRTGHTKRSED